MRRRRPPLPLLWNHDIVLLEYRGVGKASALLSTPRVGNALKSLRQNLDAEAGFKSGTGYPIAKNLPLR